MRHGSRNPGDDDILYFKKRGDEIRDAILQNRNGKTLRTIIRSLYFLPYYYSSPLEPFSNTLFIYLYSFQGSFVAKTLKVLKIGNITLALRMKSF